MGPAETEALVRVRVYLKTGRMLHKLPTGTATVSEWIGVGPTAEILVNASGAVAWIARVEDEQGTPQGYEAHEADKSGAQTLATGTEIAPNSLALAGSTLYSTQGGKPASAALN